LKLRCRRDVKVSKLVELFLELGNLGEGVPLFSLFSLEEGRQAKELVPHLAEKLRVLARLRLVREWKMGRRDGRQSIAHCFVSIAFKPCS
jgi:hypothetical protein